MTTSESAFLTHSHCTDPELRDRWRSLNGLVTPARHDRQTLSDTDQHHVHVTVASPTRTTISTWALRGPIS